MSKLISLSAQDIKDIRDHGYAIIKLPTGELKKIRYGDIIATKKEADKVVSQED